MMYAKKNFHKDKLISFNSKKKLNERINNCEIWRIINLDLVLIYEKFSQRK